MAALTKKVEIPLPSARYFNDLIRLKCGPDLMALDIFPNAKEVTESFAAWNAVLKHLIGRGFNFSEKAHAVCVGDGHTPRTGATFAYRSGWTAHSVDPALRERDYNVHRLLVHKKKIEDFSLVTDDPVVVVAVHNHASLDATLDVIQSPLIGVVAMPCCFTQTVRDQEPDIVYRDGGVWSPHDTIKVWRKVR